MRLDDVQVSGYRRFQDSTINLEHGNFAILSGANNSGKTSLIQLLDVIFNNSSRKTVKFNDFSINLKKLLNERLEELNIDLNNNENEFLEFLSFIDENIKISVKFCVSYKIDEPIGLFANYLMDLEAENMNLFFEYIFKFNIEKIKNDFIKAENQSKDNLRIIIENSVGSKYYYSDQNFLIKNEIEYSEFKNLFNFEYISADRELDDENLKNKKITTTILSATDPKKISINWEGEFKQLEENIQKNLIDSGIKERFQDNTINALKDLKDNLDEVSKNEINALTADFNFNEKTLLNLLKNSLYISYAHQSDGFLFNLTEESQGLGISNLIFMSLQINSFCRKIKQSGFNTVNLFVIEEPEAHMHIQMQKVLVDYIDTIFKESRYIQGIITTHSTEIVKNVNVNNVKVIRPEKNYMNRIVDLYQFIKKHGDKEFFETFFRLNFADIIFSDAVIFFEGDAERMYFESLITRENTQFQNLSRQYICYCQCGGAYAHKYFPLLTVLGIKACVFTDLDYSKERYSLYKIERDISTNKTLKSLLKTKEKSIGEIYKQQVDKRHNDIEVFTQTQKDGYSRTLEEAIIYKVIFSKTKNKNENKIKYKKKSDSGKTFRIKTCQNIDDRNYNIIKYGPKIDSGKQNYIKLNYNRGVFIKQNREFWKMFKYQSKLDFSIPNGKDLINIRDIVNSISKTNFMYSIIMNNMEIEVLPNYIEEGLTWLDKKISIE